MALELVANNDPIIKEMNRLLARGLEDRGRQQTDIADCYKYAMPWRHTFNKTWHRPDFQPVFDETIGTVLEDFAADMLNTFTPQKNNWLEEKPLSAVPIEIKRRIEEPLAARQAIVFAEMARSPLYQALQEAYSDLGVGTMILIVHDRDSTRPIHVEALPATDVILVRGPWGTVDTFRQKNYLRSEIEVMWPDANMAALDPKPSDDSDVIYEITDGCWRNWKDKGNETYHYVVQVKGKKLYQKDYKGPGSCPFIVARWSRDSTTAWGIGPTRRTLNTTKFLNYAGMLGIKNYDLHVNPAISYENDGVINVDGGVVPGTWVPREVGSEAPEPIESKARFDVETMMLDEKRGIVRRAHYQDVPDQLGKTPPTAFQWADEKAERARRMGTPATNLVIELQIPLYKRFAYLLQERGVLPEILPGMKDHGALTGIEPTSPVLRAQQQEDIVMFDKFLEMISVRFGPQLTPALVNVIPAVLWLAKKFGVPPELLNNEVGLKEAMKQLAPVIENFTQGQPGAVEPPPVGALQ